MSPKKLNVGCGRNLMPGWVNLACTRRGADTVFMP